MLEINKRRFGRDFRPAFSPPRRPLKNAVLGRKNSIMYEGTIDMSPKTE